MIVEDKIELTKENLINKQKQLMERIESLKTSDPILNDGVVETLELGTASWQSEAHENSQALINGLTQMSENIQKTLKKISSGSYGVCERCRKSISPERLMVFPTAQLCINCN